MPGIRLSRVLFSFQLCRGASCRFPRVLADLPGPCSFRIRRYPGERPPGPLRILELGERLWNSDLGLGCGGKGGITPWNISVLVLCHLWCPSSRRCGRRVFPAVFPAGFPHPSCLSDGLELLEKLRAGSPTVLGDGDLGTGTPPQGGGDFGSACGPQRAAQIFGAAEGRGAEDDEKWGKLLKWVLGQ